MPAMPIQYTGPGTLYIGTATGHATTIDFIDFTTSAEVWANWNLTGTSTGTRTGSLYTLTNLTWTGWNTAYEETREQQEERLAREAAHRAEVQRLTEELRQQCERANERGQALLLEFLSDEQAASRRERGFFAVRGSESGRIYRIHNSGVAGNVDRLDEHGRREMTFCCHPPGLCAPDVHLAQMLALVTDEPEFLRVANAHVCRPPVTRAEVVPLPVAAAA